ncbi:hypothetical protein BH20ACT4_BH20ACT4_10810 [soil metagenome]
MPDTSRHPASSAGVTSTALHLSIGEVLGLLLEEFPDVTISKIRFLESQGLIEPERTPSGYRKFFAHDVELLRLILREQRENFLPLRVIKDRIDSGEILKGSEPPDALPDAPRRGRIVTPGRDQLPGFEGGGQADGDTNEPRPHEPEPGPHEPDPAPPSLDAGSDPIDDTVAAADVSPHDDPGPSDTERRDADPSGAESGGAEPMDAEDSDSKGEHVERVEAQPDGPISQAAPDVAGDLVTASELAAMVSTTPGDIADLQSYGLIAPRENIREPMFDDDAVAVARICARFLSAGVDVRHLRGWKTSADRETSVYEQLTLPLLRQRNPHGREVARERLLELRELGTSLRQLLMDAELRHHIER